jgi:autotransporter-associated beta strand protein
LATDIGSNKLVFTPAANYWGTPYASFGFQVQDDGGTLNGGVDTDPTIRTLTVNVSEVNHAPQGTSNTVTTLENVPYVLQVSDFGFSDPNDSPPNNFLTVEITAPPAAGTLADSGAAVTPGQFVAEADVAAGKLLFTPAAHSSGTPYASFGFQVQDDGGTLNGGVDLDPVTRTMTVNVTYVPQVVGRYVFYHDSAWDGYTPGPSALDDAAIATDKTALLPGQTATFANYTSYAGGINGVMVDIQEGGNHAALDASDFQFAMGNDDSPSDWPPAPWPQSVSVRPGAGGNGSDRVTLIWPDYLAFDQYSDPPNSSGIGNTWLQITVLADDHTGLLQPDVFYFGNAVGESGNSATDAIVDVADEIGARNNPRWFLNPATITDPYDYNRDLKVNATDEIIARDHVTYFADALQLITVPGPSGSDGGATGSPAPGDPGPGDANVPQISVGNHILLTNTPNQVIQISVSGGQPIQGLDLNVQIADGGIPAGGTSTGPVIQSVDLLTGTIFQSNNTNVTDVDRAGGVDLVPMFEGCQTTTASGAVNASGLLATVTIDTTGFDDPQTFTLDLSVTANGPTDFAGIPALIADGTITLERPPVWQGGTGGPWSAASSWLGGVGPQAGDRLLFSGSGAVNSVNDLAPDTAVGSLAFQGGDFTLTGNEFVLAPTDGAGIQNTAGQTQIALPMRLAADSTVLVSGGQLALSGSLDTNGNCLTVENLKGAAVTIEGPVTGSGSFKKTGAGTVVMSGQNNYQGGTAVDDGTLVITTGDALPPGGDLDLSGGGGLVLDSLLTPASGLGYGGSSGGPVAAAAAVLPAFSDQRSAVSDGSGAVAAAAAVLPALSDQRSAVSYGGGPVAAAAAVLQPTPIAPAAPTVLVTAEPAAAATPADEQPAAPPGPRPLTTDNRQPTTAPLTTDNRQLTTAPDNRQPITEPLTTDNRQLTTAQSAVGPTALAVDALLRSDPAEPTSADIRWLGDLVASDRARRAHATPAAATASLDRLLASISGDPQ